MSSLFIPHSCLHVIQVTYKFQPPVNQAHFIILIRHPNNYYSKHFKNAVIKYEPQPCISPTPLLVKPNVLMQSVENKIWSKMSILLISNKFLYSFEAVIILVLTSSLQVYAILCILNYVFNLYYTKLCITV